MNENWKDYEIIASGNGEKLERWGDVILLRPDPQVVWKPPFDLGGYPGLHARYERSASGGGRWRVLKPFPSEWKISYGELTFLVRPMDFKHTGLFPEQARNWDRLTAVVKSASGRPKVLNLFGYTGAASVALSRAGAVVTHVDAAKNMVERCKTNAALSGCPADGIRYIVDDCLKFVRREKKRGNLYDGIIMDPPSYGRGPGGEKWKLETDVDGLVSEAASLLSPEPLFFLLSSYTTGLQPTVVRNVLSVNLPAGRIEAEELTIPTSDRGILLPCGCSGLWRAER